MKLSQAVNVVVFTLALTTVVGGVNPDAQDETRELRGGRQGRGKKRGKKHLKMYNYTDIVCQGAQNIPCDLKSGADDGLFVCRTYTSRRSGLEIPRSECIASDKSYEEIDACGCCDGVCPEECGDDTCTCTYTLRDGTEVEGVELLIEGEEEPVCVTRPASRKFLARDDEDTVSCNTVCA